MTAGGTRTTPLHDPVRSNDWSSLAVADLADVDPHRSVSVVIPTYQSQATVALTLAALSAQSYPQHLLEVIVVDDGSTPPIALPELRPERTRLVQPSAGWGRANACQTGADVADGEIIHWLDSDMVPYRDHVLAQARWHDAVPYAVTLGYKRFTDGPAPDPSTVREAVLAGTEDTLFDIGASTGHDWVEREIDQTEGLARAGTEAFRIHVGATATLSADLLRAAGGMARDLRLGEDSELGYRLAQAGAVFVPEPLARSWHIGPTHVMTVGDEVRAYNAPYIIQRMPLPRFRRRGLRRVLDVPVLDISVVVTDEAVDDVVGCVDSLLSGSTYDVRVSMVGPWAHLHEDRARVLADPHLHARRLHELYRCEPRVRFVAEPPKDVFPVPFRLRLPRPTPVAPDCVARLLSWVEKEETGVALLVLDRGSDDGSVDGTDDLDVPAHALLTRTAALRRAGWHGVDADSFSHATSAFVDRLFPVRWLDAGALGIGPRAAAAPAERTGAAIPGSDDSTRRWKEAATSWKARAKQLEQTVDALKKASTPVPPGVEGT